ncbi:hypothetical protein PM082_023998 [Marasmius tenuissimus]|nr:hypothetical protein PM082_023998 [Marasmius tenuissimus]
MQISVYTADVLHFRKLECKSAKAKVVESKRVLWEARAQAEYKGNTLADLRDLKNNINEFLCNSGSTYLEQIYKEYLAWTQSDHQHNTESPLELPYKVFNSMMDTVAKVRNAILNEYGARKERKECQQLTTRIQYLIQALSNLEEVFLVGESLEDGYSKGKLVFQGDFTRQWLERLHAL